MDRNYARYSLKISLRLSSLAFWFASSSAFAFPLGSVHYLEYAKSFTYQSSFANGYGFDGIIALANCSGSLVRFRGSLPEEKAMVLTNGHCLANAYGGGMPAPGEVIVNEPADRTMWVLNPGDGNRLGAVQAARILYATMTKTDVTLYELRQTYREIEEKYAIRAFTLADRYPAVGEGIDIVSGYHRRGYSCRVDRIVKELREAGWSMTDSIRYSQPGCETIGGTSGSPILSTDTKEVVGVNNTGNEDGKKCTMNNPCEVDAAGTVTYEKGLSYGQQTAWFYGCLTAERTLDLTRADCQLARASAPGGNPDRPTRTPGGSVWPSSNRR